MKTKVRLAILCSLLITVNFPVIGQVWSYGARLGMGFPGFVDEKIGSQRITLVTSAVGSLRLGDRFQIMTELGYQRKGNKYTNQYWDNQGKEVPDSTYQVRTNLDYITIPLYFRLNMGGANRLYVQFGGYYGYLLQANFTGMRFGQLVHKVPYRKGLSPHDLGIIAGGGIESPIRPGLSVAIDIKYQIGLKDLNVDPLIIGNSQPLKNKGLVMSMGFLVDVE